MSFSRTIALFALVAAACAESQPPPPEQPEWLTVWNRSTTNPEHPNFFELLEVRAHETDSHVGTPNLLHEPLAVDAHVAISVFSESYITVVRHKDTFRDEAMTTARPLTLDDSCGLLEVYDNAFRLTRGTCIPNEDGHRAGDAGFAGD